MTQQQTLRFALPAGSLQEQTIKILQEIGIVLTFVPRSYDIRCTDPEIVARSFRAQEIARYVASQNYDIGITGLDWTQETFSPVSELLDLNYSKQTNSAARWVLAVPNSSDITTVEQLQGKRVATELVNLTRAFFIRNNVSASIEYSYGATESKAPELVDAIVDVTETGSSLKANNLREIATVAVSTPRLIANTNSLLDGWKREKIEALVLALSAVVNARGKLRIEMNVPQERLSEILSFLPSSQSPDVIQTANKNWLKVNSVISASEKVSLIASLVKIEARDIIESKFERLIPNEIAPAKIWTPQKLNDIFRSRNGASVKEESVDFSKGDGLVPCIVQDAETLAVRMVGYMNAEALRATQETGELSLFSKRNEKVWTKGETNGQALYINSITPDCDNDTLLIKVASRKALSADSLATVFRNRDGAAVSPDSIDFSKGDGLVPCIIQEAASLKVRMLGYMNAEALIATQATGRVTFYSRSRDRLWVKGETSGNYLLQQSIALDWNNSALLIKVKSMGPTCHNGTDTCFQEPSTSLEN